MEKTAKHITFIGRVQGVGFRFTALRIANRYALTGLVRNLPDGSVEMIAQGPGDDISDCIRDIEETLVDYIRETKVEQIPLNSQYEDFKITF